MNRKSGSAMHATPICERAACLLCFLARRTSVQCPRSLPHLRLRRRRTFFLSVFLYLSPPLPSFLLFLQFLIVCSVCVHHEEGRIKEEAALGRVMSWPASRQGRGITKVTRSTSSFLAAFQIKSVQCLSDDMMQTVSFYPVKVQEMS